VLPRLADILRREAPRLRLVIRQADFRTIPAQIDSGDIDVAVSAKPIAPANWHIVEELRRDGFVCVYNRAQLKLRRAITLTQYLSMPHVLVSASGDLSGAIDRQLEVLGRRRNVVMAVARFSSLPLILKSMRAVASMPSLPAEAYATAHGLSVSPLPFETPSFELALVRHARERAEPALSFVCDHLRMIVLSA
jgi:LysR family transcriptional activator of mexEF-oprN operon